MSHQMLCRWRFRQTPSDSEFVCFKSASFLIMVFHGFLQLNRISHVGSLGRDFVPRPNSTNAVQLQEGQQKHFIGPCCCWYLLIVLLVLMILSHIGLPHLAYCMLVSIVDVPSRLLLWSLWHPTTMVGDFLGYCCWECPISTVYDISFHYCRSLF